MVRAIIEIEEEQGIAIRNAAAGQYCTLTGINK
jgi:hypothetical protein